MSHPMSNQEHSRTQAVTVLRRHQRAAYPNGVPCSTYKVDMYADDGSIIYDNALDFSGSYNDDERAIDLLPMDQRLEIFSAQDLGIK